MRQVQRKVGNNSNGKKNKTPKKVQLDENIEKSIYAVRNQKQFALQGKHFIATYPNLERKWDKDGGTAAKKHALKKLLEHWGKYIDKYSIAWEHHANEKDIPLQTPKDPRPHMHIVWSMKANPANQKGTWKITEREKLKSMSPDGKEGHYQGCKNWIASVLYMYKEDVCPLSNFSKLELDSFRQSKLTKKGVSTEQVAILIKEGKLKNLKDVYEKFPGELYKNGKKCESFFFYHEEFKVQNAEVPWLGIEFPGLGKPEWVYTIANWFSSNIRKPRPLKTKNLMIYGPSDIGKTRLWNDVLSKSLKNSSVQRSRRICRCVQ